MAHKFFGETPPSAGGAAEEEDEGLDALFDMLDKFQGHNLWNAPPAAAGGARPAAAYGVRLSVDEHAAGGLGQEDGAKDAHLASDPAGSEELPSLFEMLAAGSISLSGGGGAVRTLKSIAKDQRSPAPPRKILPGSTIDTGSTSSTVDTSGSNSATINSRAPGTVAGATDAGRGPAPPVALPDTAKMHREIVRRKEQCQREIDDMEREIDDLDSKIAAEHQRLEYVSRGGREAGIRLYRRPCGTP